MGTRSSIAIYRANGDIEHTYVHWDGYILGGVGETLLTHFNNEEAASDLVALGDLSSLAHAERIVPIGPHSHEKPEPGTVVAYHRDRQEPWEETKPQRSSGVTNWRSQRIDANCEYLYIWNEGRWWVADLSENALELPVPLQEAFRQEMDMKEASKREVADKDVEDII